MKEYIDREKLIAEYDRVHVGPAGGARKLMVDAPTADVVEVVRCKDCKNYCEYKINGNPTGWGKCEAIEMDIDLMANDYCSYGEREEQK